MKNAIILFTRLPIEGKTKTRLQKVFSPKECAKLHIAFLKDLNTCFSNLDIDYFIYYTPDKDNKLLVDIFQKAKAYKLQEGIDLGEKMYNAIFEVLESGYDSCVLIGSDIPQINSKDFFRAFDDLNYTDIVLGPTLDYGYYLVGMKKPYLEVFKNQVYGEGSVLKNTIESIKNANLEYKLINSHLDIDEPEDVFNYSQKMLLNEVDKGSFTSLYIELLMKEYETIWSELKDYESM